MDYNEEYIKKNPNMHLEHSDLKFSQILRVIPTGSKFNNILDIACGAGVITQHFAEYFNPTYIEGIDISQAMINKAKELDVNHKIVWKVADIYTYNSNINYDLIVCADIIEHVSDDHLFSSILSRLGKNVVIKVPLEDSYFNRFLRRFKIYDPWKDTEERYGHIHHYSESELDNVFTSNGFQIVNADFIPMPKRSKFRWEIIRLIFYPLSFVSIRLMVKFVGGFKVYYLSSNESNL